MRHIERFCELIIFIYKIQLVPIKCESRDVIRGSKDHRACALGLVEDRYNISVVTGTFPILCEECTFTMIEKKPTFEPA